MDSQIIKIDNVEYIPYLVLIDENDVIERYIKENNITKYSISMESCRKSKLYKFIPRSISEFGIPKFISAAYTPEQRKYFSDLIPQKLRVRSIDLSENVIVASTTDTNTRSFFINWLQAIRDFTTGEKTYKDFFGDTHFVRSTDKDVEMGVFVLSNQNKVHVFIDSLEYTLPIDETIIKFKIVNYR